jgi:hypothetical protein
VLGKCKLVLIWVDTKVNPADDVSRFAELRKAKTLPAWALPFFERDAAGNLLEYTFKSNGEVVSSSDYFETNVVNDVKFKDSVDGESEVDYSEFALSGPMDLSSEIGALPQTLADPVVITPAAFIAPDPSIIPVTPVIIDNVSDNISSLPSRFVDNPAKVTLTVVDNAAALLPIPSTTLFPLALSMALALRSKYRRPEPKGVHNKVLGDLFAGKGALGQLAARLGWSVVKFEAYRNGKFMFPAEDLSSKSIVDQLCSRILAYEFTHLHLGIPCTTWTVMQYSFGGTRTAAKPWGGRIA